jgi:DNA-binding CsgD family transcriptional regulator
MALALGRGAEISQVDELVSASVAGRGGALLICGEPGVGKSTLLTLGRERAGDVTVLAASGVEAEVELPYAGLLQLLFPLLAGVDELPVRHREVLGGALGVDEPRPADRFAVYVATLGLLAHTARRRGLLVIVDDIQWLDRPSTEALAFGARRVDAEPVAMLFAARSGHVPGLLHDVPTLELAGLDVASLASLLSDAAGTAVTARVAARLHVETRGNPLAAIEIARRLSSEQLAGADELPEPLPVGPDISRAFGHRIAGLPGETQVALLVAALSETGAADELAAALSVLGLDASALAPAEIANVVAVAGGHFQFAHPLLRAAACDRATAPARREAHRALAAALDETGQSDRAVWHQAAAMLGTDEKLAADLETLGRDARARAACATAGRCFEEAARVSAPGPNRILRLLEGVRDFYMAGAPEPALRLLDRCQAETLDPVPRADVQHLRFLVEAMRGSPVALRDLLLAAAARVEALDLQRALTLRIDAAMACAIAGEPRELLRIAEDSAALFERAGGVTAALGGCLLGSGRIMCGHGESGYRLLVDAQATLVRADLGSTAGILAAYLAQHHLWTERYESARDMLTRLVERARAESALALLPYLLTCLVKVDYCLGDWDRAYANAVESLSLAEQTDQPSELNNSLWCLAVLEAGRGDIGDARDHARAAIDFARGHGLGSIAAFAGWAAGLVELTDGRYGDAIAALEPVGREFERAGVEEPGLVPLWQDLAESYIYDGRTADAETALATLERQATRTGRRLAHGGAARCRGLLAGDDEFDEHFRRALSWHGDTPVPFERARTELSFGERLRRARRRREARDPLRSALEAFDALGAVPWAERTRRELAATGERARRREPVTAVRLTPQELQVALRVAEGATNREAAGDLFITQKTVETHLHHVYRKLGIRSRVELVHRLQQTDAEESTAGPV